VKGCEDICGSDTGSLPIAPIELSKDDYRQLKTTRLRWKAGRSHDPAYGQSLRQTRRLRTRSPKIIRSNQRPYEAAGYSLRHIPSDRDGSSLFPRHPSWPRGRKKTPDREQSRQMAPPHWAIGHDLPTSALPLYAKMMWPYSCPPPGSTIARRVTGHDSSR